MLESLTSATGVAGATTTEQLLQRQHLVDLFNQYNTDFYKLDSNQWLDDGAYLIKPSADAVEFVLLNDEESATSTNIMPGDSVNVTYLSIFMINKIKL